MVGGSLSDSLYLRLPARSSGVTPGHHTLMAIALSIRGRPLHTEITSLNELPAQFVQASEVVLLVSASDVTLLRVAIPPLSSSRLQAALPAIIEDRVLGDTAECIVAAALEGDQHRLIAVCDRDWLQSWITVIRQLGARRIRAFPISLCLPLHGDVVSAALLHYADHYELALRLSTEEGVGLSFEIENDSELAVVVTRIVSFLAPERQVSLSVPRAHYERFAQWLESQQLSMTTLVDEQWTEWIAVSHQAPIDLMTAIDDYNPYTIDWRIWRYPVLLVTIFAIFNIIAINTDWWRLRREGLQIRDELTAVFQRSFPNDQIILDPLAQMQQKVTTARRASGQPGASDYLVLSAALGEAWRESGNDLRGIAALEYRDSALSIKLRQDTKLSLGALQGPLMARQLKLTPVPTDPLRFIVGRP